MSFKTIFSHFGIFWPFLGKTKLVIQNRHNHHRLIIPYNAAIRKFDTPLPLFTQQPLSIPHICHGLTDGVRGEKIFHVEKFQISVHDRCGEI